MHTLNECHCFGERNRPRPRTVKVAADRPCAFVVIRVCRQAGGQVDAAAIEQLAHGCDGNKHSRIAVLCDANGRGLLHW